MNHSIINANADLIETSTDEFPSIPAVLTHLDRLEVEVRTAPTNFQRINDIVDEAKGVQAQFAKVKPVADRAGAVWIAAERRMRAELDNHGLAKGTRGQFRGSTDGSGGSIIEPPEDEATLTALGLPGSVGKHRAARAKTLLAVPEQECKRLINKLIDLGKAVTPNGLMALIRKENKAEKKHLVAQASFSMEGPFGTVVIDPPWPMQKIDREVRPNQDAFDYPVMSIDELKAFWLDKIAPRVEPDCHLFCWTTQKFLPDAINLIAAWGFRYVLTMVWIKPGGFQPIDLPQYNVEFVIYARRGTPVFIDTTDFFCGFEAPRREHSRKPDKFYDTIRRVTGGSRVDVFSREPREGFAQYGNELRRFSAEAAE